MSKRYGKARGCMTAHTRNVVWGLIGAALAWVAVAVIMAAFLRIAGGA